MGQLLELADRMERFYTDRGRYPGQVTEVRTATTASGFYTLSIMSADNISFRISATPTRRGGQDTDKCGAFILTSLGEKSVSGGLSNNDCWR